MIRVPKDLFVRQLLPFLDSTSHFRLLRVNVGIRHNVSQFGTPSAVIPTVQRGLSAMREIRNVKLVVDRPEFTFSNDDFKVLPSLTSLTLDLSFKPRANSLRDGLSTLVNLTFLHIQGRGNYFRAHTLSLLTNLITLSESCCTGITDDVVGRLPSLRGLEIFKRSHFGICAVYGNCFSSLGQLTSLKIHDSLIVPDCKMNHLTNIETLVAVIATVRGLALPSGPNDATLSQFIKLRTLSLNLSSCGSNPISDDSVSRLVNLTELNITVCQGISDQSLILLKNLRVLRLAHCSLITDKSISELVSLVSLELDAMNVRGSCFKSLSNLRELSVSNGERPFSNEIKCLTGLERLEIGQYQPISGPQIKCLVNLVSLTIWCATRGPRLNLTVVLHELKKLKKVDIASYSRSLEWETYFKNRDVEFVEKIVSD